MSNKKPTYFIDSDNELMFLEILEELKNDPDEVENIYKRIKEDKAGTHLSNRARKLTYAEMSYANLRYLIIGAERVGAEIRVKAFAAFMYRANTKEHLNKLVTNKRLIEMMNKSLNKHMKTIYKWSGLDLKEENE